MISFGAVLYDFVTVLLGLCCRWSRELCLSRSCMISFGAVLYDFRYCTAWLGAVGGPESYV